MDQDPTYRQDFRYRRPEIERASPPARAVSDGEAPYTICAITYLTRPQNLPPFYHAALSLTRTGIAVHGYGTTGKIGNKPFEEIAPGFTFTRIKIHSRPFFFRLPTFLGENIVAAGLQYVFSYVEYNVKILFRAWKCRADLIEAHDLPALPCAVLLSRIRRKPLVYHAHELWAEMGPHIRFKGFWRRLERLLVRWADLIVVPEPNRAAIYRDEYGTRELPVVVKNCPPFREAPASTNLPDLLASRGIAASVIVLYQGVISDDRCVDRIIAATEHFDPSVALVLIGSGFGSWTDPAAHIPPGRRIIWLPHVPYETLFEYTASAHIGLLFYKNTCRNNYYCAPNKLYEYLMMGLPVITCDYPGLKPFVEGESVGLCVDPEDPRAIAAAVNRIAGDPALRAGMRSNGLRLTRLRWNWEREFVRLREAYTALPAGLPADVPAEAPAPDVAQSPVS